MLKWEFMGMDINNFSSEISTPNGVCGNWNSDCHLTYCSLQVKFILISWNIHHPSNYLFTFGAAVSGPLFVSVGGMLAVPGRNFI
jgi:hypothetical protein